jgi:hypothetical protein
VEAEQVKVFEKDRHSAEYRFRNIDGTYRWLSDEQHLIRDGSRSLARGATSPSAKRRSKPRMP